MLKLLLAFGGGLDSSPFTVHMKLLKWGTLMREARSGSFQVKKADIISTNKGNILLGLCVHSPTIALCWMGLKSVNVKRTGRETHWIISRFTSEQTFRRKWTTLISRTKWTRSYNPGISWWPRLSPPRDMVRLGSLGCSQNHILEYCSKCYHNHTYLEIGLPACLCGELSTF